MRLWPTTALDRDRACAWAAACIVATCGAGAATAHAQGGHVRCTITENGAPAQGTIEINRNGNKAAAGACGKPIPTAAGKWKATVRLNGAIDNPSVERDVVVTDGKTSQVVVDFQTGVLEVRVEAKGQPGTGLVVVFRGSKRVGTLGAGVAARLSAGGYEIVVRFGEKERRYRVDLRPGQTRVIRAEF